MSGPSTAAGRSGRRREAATLAEPAGVAQRLAVLLAAGVAPLSAWRHVAQFTGSAVAGGVGRDDPAAVPAELIEAAGREPPLVRQGWTGLAAAWAVATASGAPLAAVLRDLATAFRDLAQVQREVKVALVAPVATARLVLVLPLLGVLFGFALGFDTVGVLLGTPVGWGCLVVGGGLVLGAVAWNRRLVAAAQPADPLPGLACELMAVAMRGGGAATHARALVVEALARFELPGTLGAADAVLELSRSAGAPAVELLRGEAEESRREARAAAQAKAATLSVKLMLPLGICVLPAFAVLGVVPLMVSLITSTVGAF